MENSSSMQEFNLGVENSLLTILVSRLKILDEVSLSFLFVSNPEIDNN